MLSHYSPLLSTKLICTITAIITQNLDCSNYTCAIILLFWLDLHAVIGVIVCCVDHCLKHIITTDAFPAENTAA